MPYSMHVFALTLTKEYDYYLRYMHEQITKLFNPEEYFLQILIY